MRGLQNQVSVCARAQWAMAGFLLVALAGFYVAGYRPADQRLKALQEQIRSRRRDLDANQSKATGLRDLAQEVQILEGKVARAGKKLPRQPELGEFIRDLYQIGQQSALQAFGVRPGASRKQELFYELPISVDFSGDFGNAARFLREVEDIQRLTRVRRLNIISRPADKDGKEGRVDVQVTLNIYFSEG